MRKSITAEMFKNLIQSKKGLKKKELEQELKNEIEFNLALADLTQKVISAKSIEEVSRFVLEQAIFY